KPALFVHLILRYRSGARATRIATARIGALPARAMLLRAGMGRRTRGRTCVAACGRTARGTLSAATTVLWDRRVQADRLARREAGHHVHHQVDLQQPLYLPQQATLFRRDQRQRLALRAVATG